MWFGGEAEGVEDNGHCVHGDGHWAALLGVQDDQQESLTNKRGVLHEKLDEFGVQLAGDWGGGDRKACE